ncbi:MAG: NUDIX hydrolase [Bythopirellula sp.]|nr:NUDIX hydrolase [Bythopirellula sp.]
MSDEPKLLLQASRFRVVEHTQTLRDGQTVTRQVVVHPGAVTILPLLEGGRVCLIRNYRIAVGKTLIELPAGTIDNHDPPEETAKRELQEETGYTAKRWTKLPPFFMSPGILQERMHLFVAEGLTQGATAREVGEDIDNLIVPWEEAVAMALRGEIEDAKSLVGIFQWELLRPH